MLLSPELRNYKDAWIEACKRICSIPGQKKEVKPEIIVHDLKGHIPVLEHTNRYHRNKENYRPKNFIRRIIWRSAMGYRPEKILSGNYLDR